MFERSGGSFVDTEKREMRIVSTFAAKSVQTCGVTQSHGQGSRRTGGRSNCDLSENVSPGPMAVQLDVTGVEYIYLCSRFVELYV